MFGFPVLIGCAGKKEKKNEKRKEKKKGKKKRKKKKKKPYVIKQSRKRLINEVW